MSKRKDIDLLRDIKESIERIISYTNDMEYTEFSQDYKTQDAVVRNIEIMGEATKALSKNIRENNPNIPWKNIAGTRDKLIHDYFGVNIDIVWNIIRKEIPGLSARIKEIIDELELGRD